MGAADGIHDAHSDRDVDDDLNDGHVYCVRLVSLELKALCNKISASRAAGAVLFVPFRDVLSQLFQRAPEASAMIDVHARPVLVFDCEQRPAAFAVARPSCRGACDALSGRQIGTAQVGFEQVGFAQVGFAQVGTAQVGTAQVGTAQVGSAQVGFAQIGTAQVGTAQVGTAQVGTAQVGFTQFGTAQVGTAQFGTAQVGPAQFGFAQVGFAQVGFTQVNFAQFGPA